MIQITNLKKKFKNVGVLKGINLTVDQGEIVSLIGPSGCGKTTTLKMLNRLLRPTSGEILINGTSIYKMDVIKLRRSMGYVIQQTGLFPHMTVKENMEIIPKAEKYPPEKIQKRTLELMSMIGMGPEYLDRYPSELSGGQQQRIGVARAFATNPDIILMDEPFSALDPISRSQLQDELLDLQSEMHKTIIFVTHDMDEAIKLSDRICIMHAGAVLQYDTPEEILKNPKGEFVVDFVGKNRIWQSPELIRVADIMIEHPVTCGPSLSFAKSLEKMRAFKVDTLMVTDRAGKLLGIIRAKVAQTSVDRNLPVQELMYSEFATCNPQQSLVEILSLIRDNQHSNIPVVDENGYLRGLITKSSLVASLSQSIIDFDAEGN